MAGEWTGEKKKQVITGAAAITIIAVIFLAISLFQNRGPTRCESILISGAKDDCWKQVAMETGDSTYCKKINEFSVQDQCIAAIITSYGGGGETCSQMSESISRDYCYSNLARGESNVSYCGMVTTDTARDACYLALASMLSDPSLCAMISSSNSQADCSNNLYFQQALEQKNATLCRNMVAGDMDYYNSLVDSCILSVASNLTDTSLCSGISNATLRAQCSAPELNFAFCQSISDENERNICFYSVATAGSDPDDCIKVPGESLRDNCYYQFATRLRDPLICNNIAGTNMKSICIQGAGG